MKNKAYEKLLFRIATKIANRAKAIAPVDTANLKKDIQVFDDNIHNLEVEIGNTTLAPYASFVHEGTGIYGKHKKRITPKEKKALKTPFGVYKSVRGQKAQPYLLDAAKDIIHTNQMDVIADSFTKDLEKDIVDDIKKSFRELKIEIK